eukprot:4717063-Ditylum_brightwellii.AAC.1
MTVKEWVAQVSDLNGYLKDFSIHNRNKIQPLNYNELVDILEYRVPALWCRELTVQGFDPVDQGLRKIAEFCTHLESCEPSADKPKDKMSPRSRITGKRKADTPTKLAGEKKFYCDMHGCNKTHNTKDCFELKQCVKCARQNETCKVVDKVTYKDLNAFVNTKATTDLNKAKKNLKKQKKEKNNEEDKPSTHASTYVDNNDSSASCLLSDTKSDSDNE